MILKKPYAFFIRYFKFLHLIIFVLAAILLYRTSLIYDFLREFNLTSPDLIGKELTSSLFSPILYLLIALLIVVNILIIVIMIRKDKPYIYYIVNIILYIFVLVMYTSANSIIGQLEIKTVSSKVTLAIRDISNLCRLFQTVSTVFYLIRATGFDIKKFDFVRDLRYLDITAEDSEEIEVSVEFEGNVFKRNIRKKIRDIKYYYAENKFIINIIELLFISMVFLLIYLSTNKYDKIYKENDFFNAGTLNIGIKESFILTKSYNNSKIISDDNALVALKISVNNYDNKPLQTSRTALVVKGKQYYPIKEYNESLVDLGNIYTNETITEDFKEYILLYKIPIEDINSSMKFRYIDNIMYKRGQTIVNSMDVQLTPKNLDEVEINEENYNLTETIDIDNYKITINNYELQNSFVNTYNTCITNNECYDLKEILKASSTRNKEKVLLKIEGNLEFENMLGKINNLYSFIDYFASIEYTYKGKTYEEKRDFNEVVATKTSQNNQYYIEVDKEILDATDIKLSFNLRNNKYTYVLRGNISE